MQRLIKPFLARFSVKLLTEIAPAALASVVGGLVFSQWVRSEPPKPMMVAIQPAGAEMLALLRDEHALLTELMRKDTEARLAANRAADDDVEKLKAAASEKARLALLKPSPSAKAVGKATGPDVRQQVAQAARGTGDLRPAGEPLQLLDLKPLDASKPRPPADLVSYQPAQPRKQDDGFLKRQLRGAVAAAERVPSLLRDAADWVTGAAAGEKLQVIPRLPERDFLKAQM